MSNDQRNGYDIWKELNAQDPKKAEEFLDRNFERPTEDDPADVVEAPPSQEEVAEMAAECERLRVEREGPDVDQEAQDFEDRMIQQREREANAPRAVPGSYDQPFRVRESMPNDLHEKFHTVTRCTTGDEFTHAEAQLEMLLDMIKVRLVEVIKDDPFTDWGITFLIESENVGIPSGHYRY